MSQMQKKIENFEILFLDKIGRNCLKVLSRLYFANFSNMQNFQSTRTIFGKSSCSKQIQKIKNQNINNVYLKISRTDFKSFLTIQSMICC